MTLKTYTLAVSLAATIGLLVAVTPLVRSFLEYRSPQLVDARPELVSLEAFVLSKTNLGIKGESESARIQAMMAARKGVNLLERGEWQALFDAEREQHFYAVRSKASRNLIAYGILVALCTGLLIVHLRWALRLNQEIAIFDENTGQYK